MAAGLPEQSQGSELSSAGHPNYPEAAVTVESHKQDIRKNLSSKQVHLEPCAVRTYTSSIASNTGTMSTSPDSVQEMGAHYQSVV